MTLPASHPAGDPDPALLARADWRFLLPAPPEGGFEHLVLLGGPQGLAGLLLAAGLARRVSRTLPERGAADAVAVLAGAGTAAGEAARHLAPGGVLYAELPAGPRPPLPAGLGVTGLYAVWPRLSGAGPQARAWLPLDAPGALPWFLDTLYPAATPRKRAVELALRALPDPRRAARLLTRSLALTAVAGPRRGAPAALLAHPGLPEPLRHGDPVPLLLGHGRERVALLPFPRHGGAPGLVLKVPRLPRFNGAGEQEQEVLRRVREGLPAPLAASLPRPGGLLRAGGLAVAVESCVPGRSLLRSAGAWGASGRRRRADLDLAASWLAAFHRAGALARGPWTAEQTESWVAAPLAAYRRRFGATPGEERLFAETLSRAAALAGAPVPTVWRHRDFTPWNLLRDGPRLAVIDWEGAQPGPPLCDLLHFVTLWHQMAAGIFAGEERLPLRLAAFAELFLRPGGGGPPVQAARQALAAYRRELGLDARLTPVLLVATWAELAARPPAAGAESAPREATPACAYVAALAAGRERLFAGRAEESGR